MALPKLPNVPEKVKPRLNFVYVFMESKLPKFIGSKIKLTKGAQEEVEAREAEDRVKEVLQKGSLRRAVVVALPADLDEKKFPYKVGDIVGIPFGQYDVINIDRSPIHMVGIYDISVLPDLTEEEADKWTKDQETYINEIVFPTKSDSKLINLN